MASPTTSSSFTGTIASEKAVVEVPAVELLQSLGWRHAELMDERPSAGNPTGRLSFRELVLPTRLRAALRKLNPDLPEEALQQAENALTADRSAMLPVAANREVYRLLRDGVAVQVRQADGSLKAERVAVIDWTNPAANDFFLASQVWIESSLYKRRPDARRVRQRHPAPADRVEGPHASRFRKPTTPTCATTATPSRACSTSTASPSCRTGWRR